MSNPRILVHAFSNGQFPPIYVFPQDLTAIFWPSGGCLSLTTLADAVKQAQPDLKTAPIPAQAIIFDSCPGDASFRRGAAALAIGIQNPLGKIAAQALFLIWATLMTMHLMIQRQKNFAEIMRARLLDESVIPRSACRAYIYSDGDVLIPEAIIEEHAMAAKLEGLDVRMERFDKTAHVAHMKEDPKRYWEVVRGAWDEGSAE